MILLSDTIHAAVVFITQSGHALLTVELTGVTDSVKSPAGRLKGIIYVFKSVHGI